MQTIKKQHFKNCNKKETNTGVLVTDKIHSLAPWPHKYFSIRKYVPAHSSPLHIT